MALKILFICNKSPWPPKEGGPMAMNQLIEGLLRQGHLVKVLAVDSAKYHISPGEIPVDYRQQTNIEFVRLDLRIKILPALWNWLLGRSYHVQRFISGRFRKKLTEILKQEKFDVVQMETLFMTPYVEVLRKNSRAKIVLRAHNIEHLIWQRMHRQEKNILKKAYLAYLYNSLKNYEIKALDHFDGIVPISEKDAVFFRQHTSVPVTTLPFGIDLQKIETDTIHPEKYDLVHIGAMNWLPNLEGIEWFLNEVWPHLQQKIPDIKLALAGRKMHDNLLHLNKRNVTVLGEVVDAQAFIRSGKISIAPLLSGSGIRIKILESMSLARPVVATSVGAEGIDYQAGKNILIADTLEEFALAIQFLSEHPDEARQIGKNAQKLIAEKYNHTEIITQLMAFYQKIL